MKKNILMLEPLLDKKFQALLLSKDSIAAFYRIIFLQLLAEKAKICYAIKENLFLYCCKFLAVVVTVTT